MLPIVISIPHCSAEVPPEILSTMLATGESEEALRKRLLRQGDPFTDGIFLIPGAAHTLSAAMSRFVVDLNRARNEGGENGVIKLTDFDKVPFYPLGCYLEDRERAQRLRLYYDPYHLEMRENLARKEIRFFIDGHSMVSNGPAIGPDSKAKRPAFCVANLGDAAGNPAAHGRVSCPPVLTRKIRIWLADIFAGLIPHKNARPEVLLNSPFNDGYIVESASDPTLEHAKPGIMIEVNRDLYLDEQSLSPLPDRIASLREGFLELSNRILNEI